MDTTLDSGRHPVNTGHLVMGLAFAGLVGVWALIAGEVVAEEDARWLLPIPWVAGGAIGLAVAAWANMRRQDRGTDLPDPHTDLHDTDPTEEIR